MSDEAEVDVEYIRETDMAVLFDTAEGEIWIPKSQIISAYEPDDDAGIQQIFIAQWFAEETGLV